MRHKPANLSRLIYGFYNNNLTEEELLEVEIVDNVRVMYFDYPQQMAMINNNNEHILFGGEFAGNLDTNSKGLLKTVGIKKTVNLQALRIKTGSKLYKKLLEGGFYHFNDHRKYPDSFLAFKFYR